VLKLRFNKWFQELHSTVVVPIFFGYKNQLLILAGGGNPRREILKFISFDVVDSPLKRGRWGKRWKGKRLTDELGLHRKIHRLMGLDQRLKEGLLRLE
jgi:hypothetical protein